jgi:hypothetical protein
VTDLLVLPHGHDPKIALAAARAGNVRTMAISAFNHEILSQFIALAPLIISGAGRETTNHLKRHNRIIPYTDHWR